MKQLLILIFGFTFFLTFLYKAVAQPSNSSQQFSPHSQDTLNNTFQLQSLNVGKTQFQQILISFATSYTANQNWQGNDYKNFSLIANADYQRRIDSKKFSQTYQFRGELSFLQFIDSIQASLWLKNSDFFNLSAQWIEYSERALKHSYSVLLNSQFADSWKYTWIPAASPGENPFYKREWKGGLMNPATVTLAYGLNYSFWRTSYVNFAFATINIYARPRVDDALLPTEKELARTEKTLFISEYGMSIQSTIQRRFNEYVLWDNKISFFANGLNKNQVNFDFQNRITFRFLKYLQFRVSTYLIYNPIYSYQMQYRHEFLTGIFFENKGTKKRPLP
jgi:hypothetical protein